MAATGIRRDGSNGITDGLRRALSFKPGGGGIWVDLFRVADLWEENQEFLKQRLGHCYTERHGARWVLMPDAPYPRFNHVSRVRLAESQVESLLTESRAFFYSHHIRANCVLVTPATEPSSLSAYLHRLGCNVEFNSVMIYQGHVAPMLSDGVRVERVPIAGADLVFELMRQVFLPGAAPPALAAGRRGVDISYAIGGTHYVAYWGTMPIGAGMLFRRGAMGGIYNMCTLPQFRGRGAASAIVSAAIADAYGSGCDFVGLTPTVMGRPLYERLGFQEVYQERYFVERLG